MAGAAQSHWPKTRCRRGRGRAARQRHLRSARAPPRPTRSAMAPPCTAPASSSRVIRPRSTSTMRLATSSTSSRFCSTISMERRCFSRSAARSSPISCTMDGCMPSDGSSRSSSHGSGTSARASARICCSPPDSAPPASVEQPASAAEKSEHALDRPLLGLAANPASTRGADFRARSGREGCRGPAAHRRCRGGCVRAPPSVVTSTPSTTILPPRRRQQAHDGLQQRRLAHAVVADDADRLALAELQRDAVQHRDFAVAGVQVRDVEHDAVRLGACRGRVSPIPDRQLRECVMRGSPDRLRAHSDRSSTLSAWPSTRIAP